MKFKRSKKQTARRVCYGMIKVKRGQKVCWLARQNKHGWSLGLAFNKRTIWLKNTRFASIMECKRVLAAKPLFVHMKDSKEAKNV